MTKSSEWQMILGSSSEDWRLNFVSVMNSLLVMCEEGFGSNAEKGVASSGLNARSNEILAKSLDALPADMKPYCEQGFSSNILGFLAFNEKVKGFLLSQVFLLLSSPEAQQVDQFYDLRGQAIKLLKSLSLSKQVQYLVEKPVMVVLGDDDYAEAVDALGEEYLLTILKAPGAIEQLGDLGAVIQDVQDITTLNKILWANLAVDLGIVQARKDELAREAAEELAAAEFVSDQELTELPPLGEDYGYVAGTYNTD
ncbi:MAG: hypothetical protein COA94_05650 [Rickettsiales bacterium]|nr:MAG: hypothetical protein COA94_05650 [Rickettsiales bacterium]